MRILIGCETSGELRRRFAALGHDVVSVDLLPADDGAQWIQPPWPAGRHWRGDLFDAVDAMAAACWWPDLGIFHPECTYLTSSGLISASSTRASSANAEKATTAAASASISTTVPRDALMRWLPFRIAAS
jgi:hypothetical protein